MSIIGNPLMIGGGSGGGPSGVVYITDELDEHGGIVRHLTTDGAAITDTTDAHGGIVRSITGAEVRLQVRRVTPGATEQVIEAEEGYDALGKVIVEAGGDSALKVTVNSTESPGTGTTLDKTYEEIVDAIEAGVPVVVKGLVNSAGYQERYTYAVSKTYIYNDQYRVALYSFDRENTYQFGAATATGTLTLI